ncbi:hypothetical protein HT031_000279 [Scenedesmus sp. PABB004]|nr:hypothetical protein HT031_000279 [Scenedesmus sp. PABB004]
MRGAARHALLAAAHVVVALVFLRGFLLTRLELPDVSAARTAPAGGPPPPFDRAVLLIVDALRYDCLCVHGAGGAPPHAGRLPKTLALVGAAPGAAVAARFVADTPTITMSRLKALLTVHTRGAAAREVGRSCAAPRRHAAAAHPRAPAAAAQGGLPTFLDVGQSFSASALSEDNLVAQLTAQHKRLVVMGDDTWMQLAGAAFDRAHPYPSFDVHDLHTVDDGVWEVRGARPAARQAARRPRTHARRRCAAGAAPRAAAQHLLPALAAPHGWDVLVGHYLGVDHAGHTHGVASRQMEAKLAQMDDQVSHVIETLVGAAGPGGAHERTLLLVLSDHGQTLGGDHGGGSADETDSVLLAASLRKMAAARAAAEATTAAQPARPRQPGQHFSRFCAPPAATAAAGGGAAHVSLDQIDLTPLLAHLLGVPIPFGNLGRLPPHLFAALSEDAGDGRGDGWLPSYAAALRANADQVHTYLNRYAATGGLPAAQLSSVNALHAALAARQPPGGEGGAPPSPAELEELVVAQLSYLAAAVGLARRRFTLFQQGPIWAGCALAAAVLAAQLAACWRAVAALAPAGGVVELSSGLGFAALAAFHTAGLFSVGLLMGEGRLTCALLAAATALLLRAALAAAARARAAAAEGGGAGGGGAGDAARWAGRRAALEALAAAGGALASNVALQALGLIDRSGQDPHDKTQPSADLLVGPDAALQRAALLAFTLAPLGSMWMLACRTSARCVAAGGGGGGGGPTAALVSLARRLCAVQFVALAAFWVAQLSGHADASPQALAAQLWALARRHPLAAEAAAAAGRLAAPLLAAAAGGPAAAALRAVLALPARLLLPRLVFVGALTAICGALAARGAAVLAPAAPPKAGGGAAAERALQLQLLVWLCACCGAALAMVLGFKGPATLLLAAVQAGCVVRLLLLHRDAGAFAAAARRAAPARGAGAKAATAPPAAQAGGGGSGGVLCALGAGSWGMQALGLFFCSGHFCEFSGLQYASAFIGFDAMTPAVSGPLLLLNTAGGLLLGCLGLPALLAGAGDGRAGDAQQAAGALVFNTLRFAALAACMASAAVQQQHILLWAIFAPKLMFELAFMAVTDAGQLLACALAPR